MPRLHRVAKDYGGWQNRLPCRRRRHPPAGRMRPGSSTDCSTLRFQLGLIKGMERHTRVLASSWLRRKRTSLVGRSWRVTRSSRSGAGGFSSTSRESRLMSRVVYIHPDREGRLSAAHDTTFRGPQGRSVQQLQREPLDRLRPRQVVALREVDADAPELIEHGLADSNRSRLPSRSRAPCRPCRWPRPCCGPPGRRRRG